MKRKAKGMFGLLAAGLMLMSMSASAADERLGTVVDGSLLTEDNEITYTVTPRTRGSFLASGSGSLTIAGSRYLLMSGNTTCYSYVDEVNVSLILQRLSGNKWVYVTELPTKTAYNACYVTSSGYKTVAGGYYYRIYGGHVAFENGVSEALTSYSNGIWVD